MTRIETDVIVADDRTATIQLPADVEPGERRLIVMYEDRHHTEPNRHNGDAPVASSLEWKDSVLVYTGQVDRDPMKVLEELRKTREDRFLSGTSE